MKQNRNHRILMLLENNPYPQDARVRKEAQTLIEADYQVTVVAPGEKGQPRREVVDGVTVYRYPAPPEIPSFVGFVYEYLYSLIAAEILTLIIFFREGFDAIHAHNPPDIYVFIAIFYKYIFGKKFVFDHHDLTPDVFMARYDGEGNRIIYQILMLMEKLTCKVADHIIATNESYKGLEMSRHGAKAENITVVRNGPNLAKFKAVEPDPELRAKAGTILAYVGAMGKQDGLDGLIRALWHLVNTSGRTDFYCVLMGSGDELDHLKEMTREMGLEDYIWFTGWLSGDELRRYLSTADICVGPDPSNSFNDHSTMIKMMEYMAMGKPIVSFDLTESRFSAQEAAVYVPDNDEAAFAAAICDLMDDPKRRVEMGDFGRKRIKNELAWQYSAKNLLKAYQSILPNPAPLIESKSRIL